MTLHERMMLSITHIVTALFVRQTMFATTLEYILLYKWINYSRGQNKDISCLLVSFLQCTLVKQKKLQTIAE
jgi:hypothetical protein